MGYTKVPVRPRFFSTQFVAVLLLLALYGLGAALLLGAQ